MPTWNTTPTLYVCPDLDVDVVKAAVKSWGDDVVTATVLPAYGCPEDLISDDGQAYIGRGSLLDNQLGTTGLFHDDGQIRGADIVIRDDVPMGDADEDSEVFDLQSVVTHEVGHFLGLNGHFANTSSTLFSCTYEGDTSERHPEDSDLHALEALYAGQEPSYQDIPCGGCASTGAPNAWLLVAFAAALVARRLAK